MNETLILSIGILLIKILDLSMSSMCAVRRRISGIDAVSGPLAEAGESD